MIKKKVSFHTLGCKLNFSETSTIALAFEENGFEKVKFGDFADVIVLNTCSVTEIAEKKCRQAISKAKQISPNAFIAVTGCYAQLDPTKISQIEGVDIVLGINEKFKLFEHISNFEKQKEALIYSCDTQNITTFDPSFSSGDRTRSFLKVQDGCDYVCTYCTIPQARGKSRNETVKKTIEKAHQVAELGYKEIILTGVNIGDFGKSTNENFFDLVKELDKVEGIERIRISSIEPNLLTNELIEFVAKSNKFLPHFHIPLQSGSDDILKLMKRRYSTKLFAEKIQLINNIFSDSFIGIDCITGFPGETDQNFEETYNFLSNQKISFLHIFSYSERPGTLAAEMPKKVKKSLISERSQKLHELSEKKLRDFYFSNIGKSKQVLFESTKSKGFMFGFTENYIKVEIPHNLELINKTIPVKLISIAESGNMNCEILNLY